MIDTVCLLIPKNKLTIVDLSSYGVPKWDLHSKTEQYDKFVKNPSKKDKESGLYFPRLTGYKRKEYGKDESVRIEFSVPKLLYLNNLDEVEDKDFKEAIDVLHERLSAMGVIAPKKLLANAPVSAVHFSKNIELKNGYTVSYLISEMNKVDLRKSFDFSKTRFINDGQSLYAHTTSHQFVIYDKIADLKKGRKRAIDKDQTHFQKTLFDEILKSESLSEVIRFEIRLAKKQKLNKVLTDLGYEKNPTFKDVFSSALSKKVVNDYWQKLITDKNLGLFSLELKPKEILHSLYVSNKELKPKQAVYLFGLFTLARDNNGMRELRTIVTKNSNDRTWYRLANDTRMVCDLIAGNNLRNWVKDLDKELKDFQTFRSQKLCTSNN